MTIRAPSHIFISEPFTFLHRSHCRFHNVLSQFVCTSDQIIMKQTLSRSRNLCRQQHINHFHIGGKHRCLQSFQSHRLPCTCGTSDGDKTCNPISMLDCTDRLKESCLIAKTSLCKSQILSRRHQVICRDRVNDCILIQKDIHNFLFVILFIKHTTDILSLRHSNRT